MNNKFHDNWGEIHAHEAGQEGPAKRCYFCEVELNGSNYAYPPVGCSMRTRFFYEEDCPRCVDCEKKMNDSKPAISAELFTLGIEAISSCGRTEEENKALEEIYSKEEAQALTESDIDRLEEEKGESRTGRSSKPNFHDE